MSEDRPRKQQPVATPETQFFWEKVQESELWLQRCRDCDRPYFYPRFFCPHCHGTNVEWFRASGLSKLHTYLINHHPAPGFEDEAPYAMAIVELDEGVRMMSNIRGVENTPENLVLDMPLQVVFEALNPGFGFKVPYWRPA